MAIYINGVKVAGRGISGKSPYQIAASEGYIGTEAEFNAQLAAIGEAVAGFNELSQQVNEAKADIEAAVVAANAAVNEALVNIQNAQNQINVTINNKVAEAEATIDSMIENALSQIPDAENLATKTWVTSEIATATASIVTDIFFAGTTEPTNTKLLWIDTTPNAGGLKYYNGSAWIHVPVAWT